MREKSNLKTLRKEQYDHHSKVMPFLNDWKNNPYTFIKARFYMEMSAVLVYFLLKVKAKPNTITILYALCGVIGGLMFSMPFKTSVIIALCIFFTKGILDWSDGHLARHTGTTSFTGHILDVYGAHLNEIGFYLGLGFYIFNFSDYSYIIYILPLYPFLVATNLVVYSKMVILNELISGKKTLNKDNKPRTEQNKIDLSKSTRLIKEFFNSFLDSRARTVDLICLIVLLELTYDFNVSFYIFILLIIKHLIMFIGSLLYVLNPSWSTEIINKISSNNQF